MNKLILKECQNTEYKSSWNDEYLKLICGFANAEGGKIYFGVDRCHRVLGLEDAEQLMEDISNKISTTMGIVADMNLYENNGLAYILVVVEPSNIPIKYMGKYYKRSGSTSQKRSVLDRERHLLKIMRRSLGDSTNDSTPID